MAKSAQGAGLNQPRRGGSLQIGLLSNENDVINEIYNSWETMRKDTDKKIYFEANWCAFTK